MATLVSDDPESGGEKTSPEGIQSPKREAGGGIEVGVRQRKVLWGDESIEVLGTLPETVNDGHIPETVEANKIKY